MACSWLVEATGEAEPGVPAAVAGVVEPDAWRTVARMAHTGLSSPSTSSMGRLFDAVAALCGVRTHVNYEGQAAIELEALAATNVGERGAYPMPGLDARETVRAVTGDVRAGVPLGTIGARFHNAVAAATAAACEVAARAHGLDTVALSGGVFQNRLLLERTVALILRAGLRVLLPERLPANDGGISFGQAAVAAATTHA
jgi:hydrogenase maturation protein HypF